MHWVEKKGGYMLQLGNTMPTTKAVRTTKKSGAPGGLWLLFSNGADFSRFKEVKWRRKK